MLVPDLGEESPARHDPTGVDHEDGQQVELACP